MSTFTTAPPTAKFKQIPDDFVVEELPAYEPSGAGEHVYVTLRKTGLTTPDAVRVLCHALGADARQAGWAGMKDKHAVTTQNVSIQVPLATDAAEKLRTVELPGLEVLRVARHGNKLKPGHLLGNRFTIRLREVDDDAAATIVTKLDQLARTGVANAFGPQRFGRDGANADRAFAWLAGSDRGPRDRRDQRFWFSALQSVLFDDVLRSRVEDGSWCSVLPGDLAKRHDSGGMFPVPLEGPELDDARARAEAGLVSATGPMFGASMRWPEGPVAERERAALEARGVDPTRLEAFRAHGEGTRRPLRTMIAELSTARSPGELVVAFVLPKGAYATTVLGACCTLLEPPRGREADSAAPLVEDLS
jgi:tRNA pseudouridine13 synthase